MQIFEFQRAKLQEYKDMLREKKECIDDIKKQIRSCQGNYDGFLKVHDYIDLET